MITAYIHNGTVYMPSPPQGTSEATTCHNRLVPGRIFATTAAYTHNEATS